jgi:hypothetical protein
MTMKTRLSKLEAIASPDDNRQGHRVIGDAECEARRREMIEGGQALESDNFVFRIIVLPKGTTCAT